MDLQAEKVKMLQDQVEKLSLKVEAICKHYGIGLDYQPHSFNVYQEGQEEEGSNG